MTYQPSTASLILDYKLNLYLLLLMTVDIANYSAEFFRTAEAFQNFATRAFFPHKQGKLFAKTTSRNGVKFRLDTHVHHFFVAISHNNSVEKGSKK